MHALLTDQKIAPLPRLTVVIPVAAGDALSPQLCRQLSALPPDTELRVVCTGTDGANRVRVLAERDMDARWQVRAAPRGRAEQQNAGAHDANGDWLWFLHADSRLADDTLQALADFIRRDEAALGYFDLRFLDDGPWLTRLNAFGAWWRSHAFGLPFGDQGFLLPRLLFISLGGFDPTLVRGEDHELVWRARRAGVSIRPLRAALYTSARRYAEHGWWRATREHQRETWRQARTFARGRAQP